MDLQERFQFHYNTNGYGATFILASDRPWAVWDHKHNGYLFTKSGNVRTFGSREAAQKAADKTN